MKNSPLATFALPSALVFGIVGILLTGSPASATEPGAVATVAPASPAPARAALKAAPADLTVTSPAEYSEVHGPRSITVAGSAPAGSRITLTLYDGPVVGTATAGSTGAFAIPLSFAADASYDQIIDVSGRSGARALTTRTVSVRFDSEQSATPMITTALVGGTLTGTALPFDGGIQTAITGTGTPGDVVTVTAEPTDANSQSYAFFQNELSSADIVVAPDGTWTTIAFLPFEGWTISATQVRNVTGTADPITRDSDPATPLVAKVVPPAGYIAPPVITGLANPGAHVSARPTGRFAKPNVSPSGATPSAKADEDGSLPMVPGSVLTPEQAKQYLDFETILVEAFGDHLTGAVNADGTIPVTVSGTGTPGTGVQLYAANPAVAFAYVNALYPDYFAATGPSLPNLPAATPPTFDGAVTVGADGHWSTTLGLTPGPFFLTSFTVDTSDPSAPRYSMAGGLAAVNVDRAAAAITPPASPVDPASPTAPAATAPAATAANGHPAELASTGTDAFAPSLTGGALIVLGAALAVAGFARRRPRRSAR